MYKSEMYDLAHGILIRAIKEHKPVIITNRSEAIVSQFYVDKEGVYGTLELYSPSYDDIDGKMGLIVNSMIDKSLRRGTIIIDFNKLRNLSVSKEGGRYLLRMDEIEFNFLT